VAALSCSGRTRLAVVLEKSAEAGKFNIVVRRGADGAMELDRRPLPPLSDEQRQIIEEMG